jgi:chemotaxis protein CheD
MSNQHFVGIAQIYISDDQNDTIVASNLGSCLGIAIYDSEQKKGGIIHCLLPLSTSDPEKAKNNPYQYVDTGFTQFINTFLSNGSDKKKLKIAVAGGANINDEANFFEIGKRNITVLKKLLWKNNLVLSAEDVGGNFSRTLTLYVNSGRMTLKSNGQITDFVN